MGRHTVNLAATEAGLALMGVAVGCCLLPMTNNDYRGVLRWAVGLAAVAVAGLAVPIVRGPWPWRLLGVAFASPAVFVVADCCRRAPTVLGLR